MEVSSLSLDAPEARPEVTKVRSLESEESGTTDDSSNAGMSAFEIDGVEVVSIYPIKEDESVISGNNVIPSNDVQTDIVDAAVEPVKGTKERKVSIKNVAKPKKLKKKLSSFRLFGKKNKKDKDSVVMADEVSVDASTVASSDVSTSLLQTAARVPSTAEPEKEDSLPDGVEIDSEEANVGQDTEAVLEAPVVSGESSFDKPTNVEENKVAEEEAPANEPAAKVDEGEEKEEKASKEVPVALNKPEIEKEEDPAPDESFVDEASTAVSSNSTLLAPSTKDRMPPQTEPVSEDSLPDWVEIDNEEANLDQDTEKVNEEANIEMEDTPVDEPTNVDEAALEAGKESLTEQRVEVDEASVEAPVVLGKANIVETEELASDDEVEADKYTPLTEVDDDDDDDDDDALNGTSSTKETVASDLLLSDEASAKGEEIDNFESIAPTVEEASSKGFDTATRGEVASVENIKVDHPCTESETWEVEAGETVEAEEISESNMNGTVLDVGSIFDWMIPASDVQQQHPEKRGTYTGVFFPLLMRDEDESIEIADSAEQEESDPVDVKTEAEVDGEETKDATPGGDGADVPPSKAVADVNTPGKTKESSRRRRLYSLLRSKSKKSTMKASITPVVSEPESEKLESTNNVHGTNDHEEPKLESKEETTKVNHKERLAEAVKESPSVDAAREEVTAEAVVKDVSAMLVHPPAKSIHDEAPSEDFQKDLPDGHAALFDAEDDQSQMEDNASIIEGGIPTKSDAPYDSGRCFSCVPMNLPNVAETKLSHLVDKFLDRVECGRRDGQIMYFIKMDQNVDDEIGSVLPLEDGDTYREMMSDDDTFPTYDDATSDDTIQDGETLESTEDTLEDINKAVIILKRHATRLGVSESELMTKISEEQQRREEESKTDPITRDFCEA